MFLKTPSLRGNNFYRRVKFFKKIDLKILAYGQKEITTPHLGLIR